MGIFKEAEVEQGAAKVGIFGRQGSGKTTTAAMIALGLSKTYHNSAPVFFFDTESGSDFVVDIFKAEGVKLFHAKSRAFQDMRDGIKEADAAGACAYLVDSYTHPWQELVATFKAKSRKKRLELHHMDALKSEWRVWTDLMLNSPAHCLLSGRLGFEWGEEDDQETGERKLIKLGTKLKSEADAGYEPHLLIEMEQLQDEGSRVKKTRAKKGSSVHHAYVLKDRWRDLSGRGFSFKTMNAYKPGDYKQVFNAFLPHWQRLTIGKAHRSVDGTRTSGQLFDTENVSSLYADRQRRKEIALAEVQAMLVKMWPGQDAASKEAKQRAIVQLFDVYAWRSVEEKSLEEAERAMGAMQSFVARAEKTPPANHDAAIDLLAECRDAVNFQPQIGVVAPEDAAVI